MLLDDAARVTVVIRFETVGLTALASFDTTDDGAVRVNGLAVALKANHEVRVFRCSTRAGEVTLLDSTAIFMWPLAFRNWVEVRQVQNLELVLLRQLNLVCIELPKEVVLLGC